MTGSLAARGMVGWLHTVPATLAPSTRTSSTARWSWSVANTATDNSGMTRSPPPFLKLPTSVPRASQRLLAAALGLLAVELALIQIRLRIYRGLRRLDTGRNPAHRAQDH